MIIYHLRKKALDAGINKSQHNILLFTDVDCRLPKTWITSMNSHFHDKTDYLIGVAKIDRYKNLISRFQMIDLQILFTVARGMTNLKFPFAAIGQNQAYRKTLYDKVGFLDISNSIQGDDTLFLQLCLKNKIRVDFNDDDNSFVTSRNEENFISFIKQRIRWAADLKVFWNYNKPLFIVSLSTYVTNLMIVLSTFGFILFNKMVFPFLYPMILAKLILEYILYNIGAKNLSFKMNNMTFIYWFFLNVPYVVLMGAGSFFSNILVGEAKRYINDIYISLLNYIFVLSLYYLDYRADLFKKSKYKIKKKSKCFNYHFCQK